MKSLLNLLLVHNTEQPDISNNEVKLLFKKKIREKKCIQMEFSFRDLRA
jgi:hypothetical protein